ncbi:MAG: hypothetical protein HND54_06830 [Bacteroidetes bacterium]|nr:hypothetical protein [Bacteroidota bacterium]
MNNFLNKLALNFKKAELKFKEWKYIFPDFLFFFLSSKKKSNSSSIIFVGTVMHGRIARIAKWIKREDNRMLILVCSENGFAHKLSNDSFDNVYLFRNKWHLKKILHNLDHSTNIFHLFGPPYIAAYEAVKEVKLGFKVFDYQDLMITNFGLTPPFNYMKNELIKEEIILKTVNGIVNHSLELQAAKKYYGKINAKKLFFPNYTDNDFFQLKKKTLNNEIHLVYVGSIHSAYRNKDYFGGTQLHWLIKTLNEQKIHLHIYPAPTNLKEHIVDYIEMDKSLPYFHLHESISQSDLSKELVNFDFGILPFFHRTNKKSDNKRIYSTTLKMFNFFEAGLPIIIGEDVNFQNFMANKYGGGIKASWDDFHHLKPLIEKNNYESLVNSIEKKRNNLSLKNKINKLLDFYNLIGEE